MVESKTELQEGDPIIEPIEGHIIHLFTDVGKNEWAEIWTMDGKKVDVLKSRIRLPDI